jgi:hypothetical protein
MRIDVISPTELLAVMPAGSTTHEAATLLGVLERAGVHDTEDVGVAQLQCYVDEAQTACRT